MRFVVVTAMASAVINELIATIAVTESNATVFHKSGSRDLNPNLTTPNGGRYQITPHPDLTLTILRRVDRRYFVLRGPYRNRTDITRVSTSNPKLALSPNTARNIYGSATFSCSLSIMPSKWWWTRGDSNSLQSPLFPTDLWPFCEAIPPISSSPLYVRLSELSSLLCGC